MVLTSSVGVLAVVVGSPLRCDVRGAVRFRYAGSLSTSVFVDETKVAKFSIQQGVRSPCPFAFSIFVDQLRSSLSAAFGMLL